MFVIELLTRSGLYTTGATPIFFTNLSHPFPFPLAMLYMFRKGFHPNMKYELGLCLIYGSMSLVLNFLSFITSILFFASLYSPSCSTLVVLQDWKIAKTQSSNIAVIVCFCTICPVKSRKFISISRILKIYPLKMDLIIGKTDLCNIFAAEKQKSDRFGLTEKTQM